MNDSSINSFLCDGQQADRLIHASLFSGIGGFDLAAEWMNWINAFHCEWNEFGQKVLKYYWPNAISYGDITKTDFSIWRGRIDILTGGFPCQPYSLAGQRKGKDDERHLWPEMLRAIREIAPRYIVGENVYGLTNWNGGLVFNEVQTDLESEGYEVQPVILPACAVGAPHRRERVWFVAYSDKCTTGPSRTSAGITGQRSNNNDEPKERREQTEQHIGCSDVLRTDTDTCNERLQRSQNERSIKESREKRNEQPTGLFQPGWDKFPIEAPIYSGNDGIPEQLDGITFHKWRTESIKAYGNAIVPQVALQIFKAIQIADRQKREEKTINTVKDAER